MIKHTQEGRHLIIEFYGCQLFDFIEKDLRKIIIDIGNTPLEYIEHVFKPYGKTGVMLLEESHLSIHTYPEYGYIAIDIFTCGSNTNPYEAIDYLKELFKPNYIVTKDISRGKG